MEFRLAAPINPVPIRVKVSIRWDQLFPYFFSTGLTSPCGIAKVRQTAAPWALTPSAWGIRFSSCILVYAKEISQPRKSTAMSDATQRLLQPFPNLFSFQLIPRYECNDQLSPQPFRLPLPMRLQSTMIEPSIVGVGKL
jgi:hypothetical protein